MTTLIAYGTKHGSTEKCVERLAEELKDQVTAVDLSTGTVGKIEAYDTVIIGGSIYAGKIQKAVIEFCCHYQDQLRQKRLGFFVCCADQSRWEEQLRAVFPTDLVDNAIAIGHFGYELDPSQASFLMRFIIKALRKKVEYQAGIYSENIAHFAQQLAQE